MKWLQWQALIDDPVFRNRPTQCQETKTAFSHSFISPTTQSQRERNHRNLSVVGHEWEQRRCNLCSYPPHGDLSLWTNNDMNKKSKELICWSRTQQSPLGGREQRLALPRRYASQLMMNQDITKGKKKRNLFLVHLNLWMQSSEALPPVWRPHNPKDNKRLRVLWIVGRLAGCMHPSWITSPGHCIKNKDREGTCCPGLIHRWIHASALTRTTFFWQITGHESFIFVLFNNGQYNLSQKKVVLVLT